MNFGVGLLKVFGDRFVYGIYSFMIDVKYQGQGLGKLAMLKIIAHLRTLPKGEADAIHLSYWFTNEAARRLYASVGFIETGDKWDGETFEPWDESRKDISEAEVGARLGL